jgi:predicted RNA polymerase sigma factor
MVDGPAAGLALLDGVDAPDAPLAGHPRAHAVRAHLLELAGDAPGALVHFRAAAARTTNTPERRYLTAKADRLKRSPSD